MGLKFLYYIDTSANWTLFTLGIICVPFGIGGMLLTTPVRQRNVYPPWYHATGIWVGMVFLCIAMMMPFARFHPTFLRVAVIITFLAMIVASIGLGVGIDEFTNWFENPTVKTFGSDTIATDSDVYVSTSAYLVVKKFADFDLFHKTRVIVVMAGTLLGICMLLFRIVTLGLVIFDEFTTRGYDVFTPEEEMMYQAMAEREMAGGDDGEKADYEPGYQPILYAGGKPGMQVSELPEIKEGDLEDESYEEKMKEIRQIGEFYSPPSPSIYDPNVFITSKTLTHKISTPTYTDSKGNILSHSQSEKEKKVNSPLSAYAAEETKEEHVPLLLKATTDEEEEESEENEEDSKAEATERTPLLFKKL